MRRLLLCLKLGHLWHDFMSMTSYRNDPKFSDRYAWANSADPDQTAPSLPFRLHHLDTLPYGRAT